MSSTAATPASAASPAATMQAAVQTGYGSAKDPTVLSFTTTHPTPPAPTAHQVQLRIHAASINPIDVKHLHGNLRLLPLTWPHVPGRDVAGVVVAVGSAVVRLKVGDAVMADNNGGGAYGELVNVADDQPSVKPASLSFAEAAAVPLAAQTALSAFEKASLAEGERVVVIGAAGGVGSFGVQVAKLLGASHVVAVTSAKNADYVKSLGADSVVDYKTTKLGEALQREYDVVLDCVGGKEQWDEAQKVMSAKGRFVSIVGDDQSNKLTVGTLVSTAGTTVGRKLSGLFSSQHHQYILHLLSPSHKLLDRVAEWIAAGKLKVHLDKTFEFSEQGVRDMYAYSEAGRTVGKIVMEVIKEGDTQAKQQPASATTAAATTEPSSSAASSSSAATETSATDSAAAVSTAAPATATSATTATTASSSSTDTSAATASTANTDASAAHDDPAAHSTVAAVTVAAGGTGGSVPGTVGDQPTAPHTDVSTGSIS